MMIILLFLKEFKYFHYTVQLSSIVFLTLLLYSFMSLTYILAASLLAGESGFGSTRRLLIEISIVLIS
jgi:hypothetical protein